MNNKQSSVEWFKKELEDYGTSERLKIDWKTFDELFEQAKAMEKKQCVDFAEKAVRMALDEDVQNPVSINQLYNETFGGDK
jgi:hypothetical protein